MTDATKRKVLEKLTNTMDAIKPITGIPPAKRSSKIVGTLWGVAWFLVGLVVVPQFDGIPGWVGGVVCGYGGVMACGDYVKAPWRIIVGAARDVIKLIGDFMRAKRGEPIPPDESNDA